jgi:hypothetical protein
MADDELEVGLGSDPSAMAADETRARRPHDSPLAASTVGGHCDRYGVTVASRFSGSGAASVSHGRRYSQPLPAAERRLARELLERVPARFRNPLYPPGH